MTVWASLTDEQRAFAEHANEAFVQACPGAGKTRTVVARLEKIAKALPPRRGVGVLSFTNSAVEEFTRRCREVGLDFFLRHPNYVGTFDAFVRHFVLFPGAMITRSERPLVVDSWDALGIEVRLSGQHQYPFALSLDGFDPGTNSIDPDKIGNRGLQNHVRQNRDRYEQAARTKRQQLHRNGYLSSADARLEAQNYVLDSLRGPALGKALAARFQEVIVDEGQDCNPQDVEILTWLRTHGVRVTIVCDKDQAIYAFRHGNPAGLRNLEQTYAATDRLSLSGNFRSSPAICKLAATLRNEGNVDCSLGDTANVSHPVIVLAYSGNVGPIVGQNFLAQLEASRLSSADAIVLAHALNIARRASGNASAEDAAGSSHVEMVARAVGEFRSEERFRSRIREKALRSIEGLILDLTGMRDDSEHPARAIRRRSLDGRLIRRQALSILMELPKTCHDTDSGRTSWVMALRTAFEQLGLEFQQGRTVRGFFRNPSSGRWSSYLRSPADLGLVCSTIHEAKGRQYGCVCVVIPPDRGNRTSLLFDSWERRTDEEAKRVIYVGVTRARNLSVLALPTNFVDRGIALLTAGNVPFIRQDIV